MTLSKPKIDNFLRRKVSPRQGSLHYIPVLLSDSKGFAIKRRIGLNFVEFWCEPGWRAAPAVDFLEKHLKTNQDKSFLIYIWIGTCDISEKEDRFTRVRTWDNTVVDHIVSQYHRVITIVKQYPNTKVKFIEVPCFSIFAYNKFKGHTSPDSFKVHDTEICRQVEHLNSVIREINSGIKERTLPFNSNLNRRRKDTNKKTGSFRIRTSYKFAAYYDGIHADKDLALIWTKRLTDDINFNCFKTLNEDVLDIHVTEEELSSL